MCGIVGYISDLNSVSEELISRMTNTLATRGPDDSGIYICPDKKVALGHRRLSIIDLSQNAHQPMASACQNYVLIFNGEIYNYQELRNTLEQFGHTFRSTSDSEVLLAGYIFWGEKVVELLEGMFAFAIFDRKNNQLFMGRDRFGKKPLYYFQKNGYFGFASQIKAFRELPFLDLSLDKSSVYDFFRYRYIPEPKSIFQDISKLPHGCCATFHLKSRSLKIKKYYNILQQLVGQKAPAIEDLKFNVDLAVKKRLVSDVKLGTFLSGGIDSSIISILAKNYLPELESVSIGFKPDEFSELPFASLVAKKYHIKLHSAVLENISLSEIKKIMSEFDEPMADSSCVPTYYLSMESRQHLKVMLSGDGGDELFGGYTWYHHAKTLLSQNFAFKKFPRLSIFLIKNRYTKYDFDRTYAETLLNRFKYVDFADLYGDTAHKNLIESQKYALTELLNYNFSDRKNLQYVDLNTFMIDDILVKVDRMSMAHGLEVRCPFLDHKVVECAFLLNSRQIEDLFVDKKILKQMYGDILPDEIQNRGKKGFSAPLTQWITNKDLYHEVINGQMINELSLNKDFIHKLAKTESHQSFGMLWSLFVLNTWFDRWFKH